MRNKKKKLGLIVLFSCMFVASVAFAAFSGVLTINGTVDVIVNPFNMIFTNSDGTQVTSIPVNSVSGDAEASDLTVSAEGTEISAFNVKLYKVNDTAIYNFKIKNTGGSTAYLENINMEKSTMQDGQTSTGLYHAINISKQSDSFLAESWNGDAKNFVPFGGDNNSYISVEEDSTVDCTLTVRAVSFNNQENYTITLGKITINWTNVNPNTSA